MYFTFWIQKYKQILLKSIIKFLKNFFNREVMQSLYTFSKLLIDSSLHSFSIAQGEMKN